jgi:hypothetical protein
MAEFNAPHRNQMAHEVTRDVTAWASHQLPIAMCREGDSTLDTVSTDAEGSNCVIDDNPVRRAREAVQFRPRPLLDADVCVEKTRTFQSR